MDITITPVDVKALTDDQIAEINDYNNILKAESRPEDPPTPVELMIASIRTLPDFIRLWAWSGRDSEGRLVGAGQAQIADTGDNEHMLHAGIDVLATHRRRGIGRRMLAEIAEVAEAEGRTLILGSTSDRVPAGGAFAERAGFQAAQVAHVNRLVLADVDGSLVNQWIAEGPSRAEGYSLVAFDGDLPDSDIESLIDLMHVMNTAPRDDIDMEDENMTVEHWRAMETGRRASGTEYWLLAARHDATKEWAGFTEVSWNPKLPKIVSQGGTGVRPDHRGHALGKWLKATMLRRVLDERADAEDIRTGNADSNDAMLGINRQLGFGPHIAQTIWQVSLKQVQEYLAT